MKQLNLSWIKGNDIGGKFMTSENVWFAAIWGQKEYLYQAARCVFTLQCVTCCIWWNPRLRWNGSGVHRHKGSSSQSLLDQCCQTAQMTQKYFWANQVVSLS